MSCWCTWEFCSKNLQFFCIKQVTSSIYKEAIVKIFNFLNSCLQDVLKLTPASNLTTLFCILNTRVPFYSPHKSIPERKMCHAECCALELPALLVVVYWVFFQNVGTHFVFECVDAIHLVAGFNACLALCSRRLRRSWSDCSVLLRLAVARFWSLVLWIIASSSVMVTLLERYEGLFSFLSSSGSATCPDSLSSTFAYRGSSTLKRDIALPLLAFSLLRCPSVSSWGVKCSSVSAKWRAFVRIDVVKVTVRLASWITIRTCITVVFVGHRNPQYYSIEVFCYIMCTCVLSISGSLNSGYWRLLPSGGCLWNSDDECFTFECRLTSPANLGPTRSNLCLDDPSNVVYDISNSRDGHAAEY